MRERKPFFVVVDRLGLFLVLLVAALLRSNLDYRTAFVDEAINLYGGWQMLHGQETYAATTHLGWPVLSFLPVGLAGWLGGLEAARGLTAIFGVLTVLFVMLVARKAYGGVAGFIAGGIFAVYGPAIFISTFTHQDAQSVMFASIGVYLWISALKDDRDLLYALGGLAMTASILTKYTAIMVAASMIAYGILVAAVVLVRTRKYDRETFYISLDARILKKLVLALLPFGLLLIYAAVLSGQLMALYQVQVLGKQGTQSGIGLQVLRDFADLVWLPALLGLVALLWRRNWVLSFGFLMVGLSMIPYHMLNKDASTLFKHTCYMMIGLAPLAAGGITMTLQAWRKPRLGGSTVGILSGVVGLIIIGYIGLFGQQLLPYYRSYWPDTSELMSYLRNNVQEGDAILMEGGQVAEFYLIEKGTPGHIPGTIDNTWWYEDEQGQGIDAFHRAIDAQRFDFIIFDDSSTKDTNDQLRAYMKGLYDLIETFPAYVFGNDGVIEVYTPVPKS